MYTNAKFNWRNLNLMIAALNKLTVSAIRPIYVRLSTDMLIEWSCHIKVLQPFLFLADHFEALPHLCACPLYMTRLR